MYLSETNNSELQKDRNYKKLIKNRRSSKSFLSDTISSNKVSNLKLKNFNQGEGEYLNKKTERISLDNIRHKISAKIIQKRENSDDQSKNPKNFSESSSFSSKKLNKDSSDKSFTSSENENSKLRSANTESPKKNQYSDKHYSDELLKNSELLNQNFSNLFESPQNTNNRTLGHKSINKTKTSALDYKSSGFASTSFSETSSRGSLLRKKKNSTESQENSSFLFENFSKIQQKILDLQKSSDKLIVEDPDESMRNTYSLFDKNDKFHAKILTEFPNLSSIPKNYQIELFRVMAEHEKNRCVGKCKHLLRVQMIKYSSKGIPYPIKKTNMEYLNKND